jgi:hypothetical protein
LHSTDSEMVDPLCVSHWQAAHNDANVHASITAIRVVGRGA